MFQWIRDFEGILVKVNSPLQSNLEVSLNLNTMEPLPKEHKSQQGDKIGLDGLSLS